MKRHHHTHIRLAYIIILCALAVSGAWLFINQGPSAPPPVPAYLSAPDNSLGESVSVILFPNASTRINLTLNEAATGARLRFSGTATDLNAVMGGKNILQSNGRLAGDIFVTDFAAPTIYDAKDAPFLDLNHNGIADDYERRHRLTSQQIQAVNSLDNMTPLRKYEYYAKTGREIDPIRIDTDGDGIEDATEASIGTDPINYLNTPVHSFAETPYFFAQNEILSDPRLIVYWSFDVPSQEQMGRAPLALFNNTYIEPGPNGMALHLNNKSQGARAAQTIYSMTSTTSHYSHWSTRQTTGQDMWLTSRCLTTRSR